MYVWPKWRETRRLGLFWCGKWAWDASDASQSPSHPRPRRPPPYPPPPRSLSPPSSLVWDASRWWCMCPCLDGGGCDLAVRCVVIVKITINRKNGKKKAYRGPKRRIDDASLGPFLCSGVLREWFWAQEACWRRVSWDFFSRRSSWRW